MGLAPRRDTPEQILNSEHRGSAVFRQDVDGPNLAMLEIHQRAHADRVAP
jgi:hypothetical protein